MMILIIHKKVTVNKIPFITEVIVRAHQIPFNPMRLLKMRARGILIPVKIIVIILQRWVFPSPDNAPPVVSSTHINASPSPTMTRYPTAVSMAFGS